MKNKVLFTLALIGVVSLASALYAFTSLNVYRGQTDVERTLMVAGDTVVVGSVVAIDYDFNANTTGTWDTGAVIERAQAENDTYVIGIAEQSAVPGQTVRVVTRGVCLIKIDGSDSGGASMVGRLGGWLSAADRNGFAGSSLSDSGSASGPPAQLNARDVNEFAYLTGAAPAATDTGAITTYPCYFVGL